MLQPGRSNCKLVYSAEGIDLKMGVFKFSSGSNDALEEFLSARNPKQQHSSKLESYLIKPIQVLRQ